LTVDAMSQLLHRHFHSEPIELPVEEVESIPASAPPTALH
jgi:hypothetical protein